MTVLDAEAAFRRAVSESLYDLHPARAYSDWLVERGLCASHTDALFRIAVEVPEADSPRLAWADAAGGYAGELVRVQCRLAAWPCECKEKYALQLRERELLEALLNARVVCLDWSEWDRSKYGVAISAGSYRLFPPGGAAIADVKFHRGFVGAISISESDFLKHARALAAPFTEVKLAEAEPWQHESGRCSWFRQSAFAAPNSCDEIDDRLFDCLQGGEPFALPPYYGRTYITDADAQAALSAACIQHTSTPGGEL